MSKSGKASFCTGASCTDVCCWRIADIRPSNSHREVHHRLASKPPTALRKPAETVELPHSLRRKNLGEDIPAGRERIGLAVSCELREVEGDGTEALRYAVIAASDENFRHACQFAGHQQIPYARRADVRQVEAHGAFDASPEADRRGVADLKANAATAPVLFGGRGGRNNPGQVCRRLGAAGRDQSGHRDEGNTGRGHHWNRLRAAMCCPGPRLETPFVYRRDLTLRSRPTPCRRLIFGEFWEVLPIGIAAKNCQDPSCPGPRSQATRSPRVILSHESEVRQTIACKG